MNYAGNGGLWLLKWGAISVALLTAMCSEAHQRLDEIKARPPVEQVEEKPQRVGRVCEVERKTRMHGGWRVYLKSCRPATSVEWAEESYFMSDGRIYAANATSTQYTQVW